MLRPRTTTTLVLLFAASVQAASARAEPRIGLVATGPAANKLESTLKSACTSCDVKRLPASNASPTSIAKQRNVDLLIDAVTTEHHGRSHVALTAATKKKIIGHERVELDHQGVRAFKAHLLRWLAESGTNSVAVETPPPAPPQSSTPTPTSTNTATAKQSKKRRTAPPPAAEPPVAHVAHPVEPVAAVEPYRWPVVSIGLDVELLARRFAYTQLLTANLASYSVPLVPTIGGVVEVYPFSTTRILVLSAIGFYGGYSHSLYGRAAPTNGGASIASVYSAFDVGFGYRIPIDGQHGHALLVVTLGMGVSDFDFHSAGALTDLLPVARYLYARPALQLVIPIWRVKLFGEFGYRGIIATGTIDEHFPRDTPNGIDARVGMSIDVGKGFGVAVSASYTRMFFAFHSHPFDDYIAGGALDEYLSAHLGVFYAR